MTGGGDAALPPPGWTRRNWTGAARLAAGAAEVPNSLLRRFKLNGRTFQRLALTEAVIKRKSPKEDCSFSSKAPPILP